MLSDIYSRIRVVSKDPSRGFDILEREVIWNRDRGQCQNPDCSRPNRSVSFRDARMHHIVEHCSGGETVLRNGILICPECHSNRPDMQRQTEYFQAYIERIYDPRVQATDLLRQEDCDLDPTNAVEVGVNKRIKIVIDWGALDVNRATEVIQKSNDVNTIVELIRLLLNEFKKPMRDQLTELPVINFPLSSNPMRDFLNQAQNTPYSHSLIPGTDLYFCGQSDRSRKVERLRALFARLTLPDGCEFPDGCVTVTVESGD